MTLSEFWVAMDAVFGSAYGRSVYSSQVLVALKFRTAAEAIEAGVRPQDVWEALCDAMDVSATDRWQHTMK